MDEPLVNLDFKLRESLEVDLRAMLKQSQMSVVYTSSDPRDAFNLGDKLILLSDGKKLQSGTPIEVYRSPVSVTAMDLLADPAVNRLQLNGQELAIRPEHLTITPHPGKQRQFEFEVTAIETNGDESFLHGLVHDNEWVMRHRGLADVTIGECVELFVAESDVVAF